MEINSVGKVFDDQTEEHSEEYSVEENDAWGDKLKKTYKDEILIGCANVGRLWIRLVTKGTKNRKKNIYRRKGQKYDKNKEVLQWINDNNFDVFGMCETGLDWDKLPPSRNLKAQIKRLKWKEQTSVITATNRYIKNKKTIWGGVQL